MELFKKEAAGAATASGDVIKDGSAATFMADVIEASMTTPVIVDFWATWCGPCKTLGPALERLVREAKGKIKLVKIDVDRDQQLAAQMRIQTVPTVYAFKGGRPVDGFNGALPDSQLKAFIARLGGEDEASAAIEDALTQAASLVEAGELAPALDIYREIIGHDPTNGPAQGGLLKCLILAGSVEEAKKRLAKLPPEVASHPDVLAQKSAIDLAEAAQTLAPTAKLERRLAEDANDHQARFDLAVAEFAAGRRQEAVDHLLELYRRDRSWNDEAARAQLVKLFDAMGGADPLTVSARRRLSSLMFS